MEKRYHHDFEYFREPGGTWYALSGDEGLERETEGGIKLAIDAYWVEYE